MMTRTTVRRIVREELERALQGSLAVVTELRRAPPEESTDRYADEGVSAYLVAWAATSRPERTPAAVLYEDYTAWSRGRGVEPYTPQRFGREVARSPLVIRERTARGRFYSPRRRGAQA